MSLLLVLVPAALAGGLPHNPLGLELRPAADDELAEHDAIQVARRVSLLPEGVREALAPVGSAEREGWWASASVAGDQVYGVGRIRALCDVGALQTEFECPRGETTRPVDLDALQTAVSVAAHNGDWSVVYTGRITQLQLEPRTLLRPLFPQVFTTMYAPMVPASIVLDRIGITEVLGFPRSVHLFAGVWHPGEIQLALGLTLEGRPYLRAAHDVGLELELLGARTWSRTRWLSTGARRVSWGPEDGGVSTFLVQHRALVDLRTLRARPTTPVNLDRLGALPLWTVHAAHEDILGVLDVTVAASLVLPTLTEASVGLHTTTWLRQPEHFGARITMGMAGTPPWPGYDLPRRSAPMAELAGRIPAGDTGLAVDLELGFNDPDHLLTVPTGVGAVSFGFRVHWPATASR